MSMSDSIWSLPEGSRSELDDLRSEYARVRLENDEAEKKLKEFKGRADNVIKAQKNLINAAKELVESQENKIEAQEGLIKAQENLIKSKENLIKKQEDLIDAQSKLINATGQIMKIEGEWIGKIVSEETEPELSEKISKLIFSEERKNIIKDLISHRNVQ